MDILALLSDLVRRNLVWAPVVAFAVAFLESLPFVGLFVPGTSMLLGLGAAVALMGGPVAPLVAAAACGAVLGAWISYGVGRRYGERITRLPFLLRRPRIMGACESLFRRHGMMSVAIARFLPVARPMTPMVAGAFGLEARRFHLVNLVSVLLWAPAFILPGALTGMAAGVLGGRAVMVLLGLIGILGLSVWSLLRLRPALGRWAGRAGALRQTMLDEASRAPRGLNGFAHLALCPRQARPRAVIGGVVLFALLILYIANLAADVLSQRPVIQADQAVANLLGGLRSAKMERLSLALSLLGKAAIQLPIMALGLVLLNHRRRYHAMAALVGGMALVTILAPTLGAILDVSRPGLASLSDFPSRPAATGACLLLILAGVAAPRLPRALRAPTFGLAALSAAGLGAALIYRDGHWPSEVVAGLALGVAVAAIALPIAQAEPKARRLALFHPPWALGGALAATALLALPGLLASPGSPRLALADRQAATAADLARLADVLPDRRTDLTGKTEEPFSALWIGDLAPLEAALRREGWSNAPTWRPTAAFGFLDAARDLRRLPVTPVLHEGRAAVLTLSRPNATAQARDVLRIWPAGVKAGQASAPVYVGSLTREVAARPARLFVAIREHDETSLHDPTLARLAPLDPAAWSNGRPG
jgi:undecaprenyl-diphosphatase